MKKLMLSLVCLVVVASCGGRKRITEFAGMSSAEVPNVMTIRTGWLKDKKNSFDTELWITNTHKNGIVIPVGSVSCSRGPETGSFRFLSFDGGMLQVVPGEQRRIIGVCDLPSKNVRGSWVLNFKNVAELANNGGAGKVLAKEAKLKLSRSVN